MRSPASQRAARRACSWPSSVSGGSSVSALRTGRPWRIRISSMALTNRIALGAARAEGLTDPASGSPAGGDDEAEDPPMAELSLDDLMFRPGLMKGQRILITGGGTGLGKVMAEACLMLGAEVYICGRRGGVIEA